MRAIKTNKILVITPISHIENAIDSLDKLGQITVFADPTYEEVYEIVEDYDCIFTNPNKSRVKIDKRLIDKAIKLRCICTASTGVNHIDVTHAVNSGIKVIALTKEIEVIKKITSTAELAFTLTLSSLRNLVPAAHHVVDGFWDYTQFIGRQMNSLTVGVIGYGRLGSLYAHYAHAFGAKVFVYDPFVTAPSPYVQVDTLEELAKNSDVISLHVHVSSDTCGFISKNFLKHCKATLLLINTSRGDVVNEVDLCDFLELNPHASYATDVIADEINNRLVSPVIKLFRAGSRQIIVTPHIGGMTVEAQKIAYNHAIKLLGDFLKENE